MEERPIEPAQAVAFGGAELLQLGEGAPDKHLLGHRRLQLRLDRLHTLEAALQRLAQLIAEAAVLAAGTPGATQQALWWVSVCQSLGPVGKRVARAQPSIRGQPPPLVVSSGAGGWAAAGDPTSSDAMAASAGLRERSGNRPGRWEP